MYCVFTHSQKKRAHALNKDQPPRPAGTDNLPVGRGVPLVAIGVLFGIGGMPALVYQVVWQRILCLQSGVGIYSVAMIIAAFLFGLGVGSHVGGVLSSRFSRSRALLVFVGLQLATGVFAALSCTVYYDILYLKTPWLYTSLWRAGIVHFSVLLVPTALMGMTLPFLVRATVDDADTASSTVGFLYGINTLGAAVGALVAPWVLIRFLGMRGAVNVAAGLNVFVGIGALALGWRAGTTTDRDHVAGDADEVAPPAAASRYPFVAWLGMYALSGFIALGLEVLWFRIIEVAVKSTAFTYGSVLSVYLGGLAVGSLVGARLSRSVRRPLPVFLACQVGILLCAGVALICLAHLPPDLPVYRRFYEYWVSSQRFRPAADRHVFGLLALYVALPVALYALPTLLMGFSFTVLQRAVQDDVRTSGRKVGLLQAANIVGCTAGSLIVGLVGLAVLGTAGAMRVLLGLGFVYALIGVTVRGWRSAFALSCVAMALTATLMPSGRQLWMRLHGTDSAEALIAEDTTGVFAITPEPEDELGEYRVTVAGVRNGCLPFSGIHSEMGLVPAVIHPCPRDVAVIGLASGDTAWAASLRSETQRLEVMEICRTQLPTLHRFAARQVDAQLGRLLRDPRLNVIVADARSALSRARNRYDLIVADPLVPVSAYSGNLYSVEFYRLCSRALKRGGVMCTWAPTGRVRRAFSDVMSHVIEFRDGEIIVGSNQPLSVDTRLWVERLRALQTEHEIDAEEARDLETALRTAKPFDARGAKSVKPNRDLYPRDEFLAPD